MSVDDAKRELVTKWMEMAQSDLAYAQASLALDESFRDKICFHCQQAAEKALKALLVASEIRFPKTHDLRALLSLLSSAEVGDIVRPLSEIVDLNDYAVELRYPDDWYEPSQTETLRAIELAEKTVRSVLQGLNKMGYELNIEKK